jgi:tetratricopeptide (TPR) repeat protein
MVSRSKMLLFIGVTCFLAGPTAAPGWAENVTLQVDTVPAQALVFIDREVRGQGHVELELPAGAHLLRVSAGDAWETYQVDLDLTSPQALSIKLKPSSETRVLDARHELEGGHLDQARDMLLVARGRSPVAANWWLGLCEWMSHRPAASLAAFRSYAQYVPDWPELYLFLGDLHEQMGNYPEAFTAYKMSLLKRDGWADAVSDLSSSTQAAIDAMGQPTVARDQLRLSQLLMLKGQLQPAVAEVKLAVAQTYGDWQRRDWLKVEPKLIPEPSQPPPAAPEDTQH